ncbi:polysaccharide biosynthesis protein [Ornithinibacillus gellani]|uniref:nucleoside-diphosphate sugar epimerase/dehydratase n=1 Tax=Ornithinibacillus gellani TaxID=2293253 RepID=UPI000F4659CB|nr:nucleoside-diphosphate sugar epimerase/dehydratase [Ornithinibacillus gellani]TQS74138.1 polysaccharide biosynthesis protein [Ornithinibacillus gellani]
MTYRQRLSLFMLFDTCLIAIVIVASMLMARVEMVAISFWLLIALLTFFVSHYLFSIGMKLYKKVWEYASIGELWIILKVATYSIGVTTGAVLLLTKTFPWRMLASIWLLHMFLIGGSRFLWRVYRDNVMNRKEDRVRTLIVGAGSAGTMVARQLQKNKDSGLVPVAFIDDDPKKHQLDILSLPVVGAIQDITRVVEELRIDNIIISIPSLSRKKLNIIFSECAKTDAQTKILPLLEDLITGKITVQQFRDVRVEDLLGRDPVQLDMARIASNITNKVILVTGAGGSIGSELARQIALFSPKQLILLGHGENSIYTIDMELRERVEDNRMDIITEIADIQDAEKMDAIVKQYKPDVIYHAAAHKHVPLMEKNPDEAVKNNIIGTWNMAQAAKQHQVKTFVMVSTDKAVNPTSVMGASKRLAEMIIQHMNQTSKTTFVAVRFGNVLGSRGSVIPLFKKQIEKGGPITITHPDMVRYFMTIPEASRLVMQAGSLAKGGEIFVLDMGDPVKIVDLAKNLIKLSGHSLEEIELEYTGVRPGEKLYEELLLADEVHEQQVYPKIYIGKTTTIHVDTVIDLIASYQTMEKSELRNALIAIANHAIVPERQTVMTV